MLSPVAANVFVQVSVRLDKHETAAGRCLRQFIHNARGAVLLLRRRVDQHIAVRENVSQPVQIGAGRIGVARIGVGTIDEDDILEQITVGPVNVEVLPGESERLQFGFGVSDECRPARRWPLPSGGADLLANQRIDQRALPRSGATKGGDHKRTLQPDAQRLHALQHTLQYGRAAPQRPPGGFLLGPVGHRLGEVVHLGEHFQSRQFLVAH